jgi:hypothetical protein
MNFLEYKERDYVISHVNEILSKWDEAMTKLDTRLAEIKSKF